MPRGVYERKLVPPTTRFWRHVRKQKDGCWIWIGALNGKYGAFGVSHRDVRPAHRFSYEMHIGAIPLGLTIDHLCRNTRCVNPAHLEAVTLRENIMRGDAPTVVLHRSGKCARGHDVTPENLYVSPGGKRQCIACRNEIRATPEYRAKQAARARLRRIRKRLSEAGN